jgi:hypothetical protein
MSPAAPLTLRRVGLVASLPLLLMACASFQNTLAQGLAQAAWDACQAEGRIPNQVQLTRIDVDGGIHWFGLAGSFGFADAQNCIQEKYREGTRAMEKRASISTTPAAAPAGASAVSGTISIPTWNVGDEWAFRWESPSGKGTFVWSVDRKEVLDGVEHFVIGSGTRDMYYRAADGALMLQKLSGNVVERYVPGQTLISFPLFVGKRWEDRYTEEKLSDRITNDIVRVCHAEAEEVVTVPAGTFRAIHILCSNQRTGAIVYRVWYSPEIKHMVRQVWQLSSGTRTRELIAYKLR